VKTLGYLLFDVLATYVVVMLYELHAFIKRVPARLVIKRVLWVLNYET
jgi:hypothetical protein